MQCLPHELRLDDVLDYGKILLVIDMRLHDILGQELTDVLYLFVQYLQVLRLPPLVRVRAAFGDVQTLGPVVDDRRPSQLRGVVLATMLA